MNRRQEEYEYDDLPPTYGGGGPREGPRQRRRKRTYGQQQPQRAERSARWAHHSELETDLNDIDDDAALDHLSRPPSPRTRRIRQPAALSATRNDVSQTATPGEALFAYSLEDPATNPEVNGQLPPRFEEPHAAGPELSASRLDPAPASRPSSPDIARTLEEDLRDFYGSPTFASDSRPDSPEASSSEFRQSGFQSSRAGFGDQSAQSHGESNIEQEEETPAEVHRRLERENLEELERHLEEDTGPYQRTEQWVGQAIRCHDIRAQQSGRAQRRLFCEIHELHQTDQDQGEALEELRQQNTDLEQQNASLREESDLQQRQIDQQHRQIGQQHHQIDDLQARLAYLDERDARHEESFAQLEDRIAWLEDHVA